LEEAAVRIAARIGWAVVRVRVEWERKDCRKARWVVSYAEEEFEGAGDGDAIVMRSRLCWMLDENNQVANFITRKNVYISRYGMTLRFQIGFVICILMKEMYSIV